VETFEDIIQEISPTTSFSPPENNNLYEEASSSSSLDSVRQILNENLSLVPINVDEVIRQCQLSASEVWVVLLEMEIAGCLERHPGGKVSLKEEWKSQ
jgi:DNA processing protein